MNSEKNTEKNLKMNFYVFNKLASINICTQSVNYYTWYCMVFMFECLHTCLFITDCQTQSWWNTNKCKQIKLLKGFRIKHANYMAKNIIFLAFCFQSS